MPERTRIHEDFALTNVSIAFKNDRLIADRLVPNVLVKHETNVFYVYTKDNLREEETLWADRARANRAAFEVSTSTYVLARHALEDLVTDRARDNADKAIRLDVDTTESLTDKLLIQKEKDASDLFGGTNWDNTTSLTAAQAWSANTTTSNPILFVDSAASTIARNSGKLPNVVVLNDPTFRAAKEHVSIVDRIKYTSSDSVSETLLAKLFNVQQVMVAGGIENTGDEGLADSMQFIWTDTAFVGYFERSPGLKKPSAAYRFMKSMGGGGTPMRVDRRREEETEGDVIRVSTFYQHRAVASDCGYQIIDTIQ